MEISSLPLWQWFVVIGILLMAAEVFVPGFVVLPLGLGFLLASFFAAFIESEALVFLLLAVCLVVAGVVSVKFLRPKKGKPRYLSNADRLIGNKCTLTESIVPPEAGRIKVAGDVFFAVSESGRALPVGSVVVIKRFEGNKAVVALADEPVAH